MIFTVLTALLAISAQASSPNAVPNTATRTMDVALAELDLNGAPELIRAVEGATNQVLGLTTVGWRPSER